MSDISRYAHKHTFPNGNDHRHVHWHGRGHPEPVNEAHPQPYYFLCVDCEPWRAQSQAVREATGKEHTA
jgi:hypothetical protein